MRRKSNGRNGSLAQQLQSSDLTEDDLIQQIREFTCARHAMAPDTAVARYVKSRKANLAQSTLNGYESKLSRFIEFCHKEEISDLRELDGRVIDEYSLWLRYDSSDDVEELSDSTMKDEMYLFKDFVAYLEKIEVVRSGLSDSVEIPDVDDESRDIDMDPNRVEDVLEYLNEFKYASLVHVVWLLTARTGRRLGGLRSLDVEDVHIDDDDAYLEFHHRPPETRLKNGEESEEMVSISQRTADVISDYIEKMRPDITDEDGREPLLASSHGRVAKSTIRRYLYSISRPCAIGNPCPHDRNPDSCEANQSMDEASKCPASRSPHALRHGYLTQGRRTGVPTDVLSDRCDVSEEVLREYYDETTDEERRGIRREILNEYTADNGGGYL